MVWVAASVRRSARTHVDLGAGSTTTSMSDIYRLHNRLRVRVRGLVQGVGFRPFVYRLALDLGLTGFVKNDEEGVHIEVEGPAVPLQYFLDRLESEPPPLATVREIASTEIGTQRGVGFTISSSTRSRTPATLISPDTSLCDDCLSELFDPKDRRYRYPFINCTNCGPRYTIVEHIPYDRPLTSMRTFDMCPDCKGEYLDPTDRRFHAQPNACPVCGPQVTLRDRKGEPLDVTASIDEAARRRPARGSLQVRGDSR